MVAVEQPLFWEYRELMNRIRQISHALFGRHRLPALPDSTGSVPDDLQAQGEASMVPRQIVSQTPGYQKFLLPGSSEFEMQSVRLKRYKLIQEMRRMTEFDPRVNRILYKLSSDASENSFSVNVEDGPGKRKKVEAQGVIDRCRFLINDKEHLRGWIESLLRDGDLFLQMMVSPEREIMEVKKLAAEITYSRMDAKGNFPEKMKPYFQSDSMYSQQVVAEFEEWELVHAKWRSEDGNPYGKPLFHAAQKSVKRVDSGEDDMSIRRKLRAGLRFFFNIGTPDNPSSWEEVEKFKEANKDTLENPTNAVSNIYGNGLMDMKPIEGDSQLGNKEDISHFEGLITMVGLTPSALISGGREQATNLNVVDAEDEDYSRTLMSICWAAEYGILRPIIDTALTLSNINPDSIDYTLNWGVKSRESDYRKMQKAMLWIRLGYSHETAYNMADIDNGVPYEGEIDRIRRQQEEGVIPYSGPMLSRSVSGGGADAPETPSETQIDME